MRTKRRARSLASDNVELSDYNKKMRGLSSREDIEDDDREAAEEFEREGVGPNAEYRMTSLNEGKKLKKR